MSTIDRKPAYARITDILRSSLDQGSIRPGTVLLEGPLAALFQSSRSPVKQALTQLETEGRLRRFDGRGLVAGAAAPIRLELDRSMLVSADGSLENLKTGPADALYYTIEREISLHSLFGRFRVNELALARHFGIGRSVAREILLRAQRAGLLTKGDDARWWIVELDHARFRHLYELRELLEPAALAGAARNLPPRVLAEIAERHRDVAKRFPDVGVADLDQLEEDLHVTCLAASDNQEIFEALRRSRTILVCGKHIQIALLQRPMVDPFMDEHLRVIEAMQAGAVERAQAALLQHLRASHRKAAERLDAFHGRHGIVSVDYIAS